MDGKIVKAILCSCESATKDLDASKHLDYQSLVQKEKFLPTSDIIFNALSASLTNLLCYKVSKEAYQRYSVRTHIINVLRDWCRITEDFEHVRVFTDQKQTLKFINNLLEKHLTLDVLDSCDSVEHLVSLTNALMCLASRNNDYSHYVEKLLIKVSQLEISDESELLLHYAVEHNSSLNLKLSTIEDIYISQKCKLVEQPLLDNFVSTCTELNKTENANNSESIRLVEQLLEFVCKSPCIFQLVCAFLKELLVQLNYAPAITNFIQDIVKKIQITCENHDKNILDLYPKKLQSCVILLQIELLCHTRDSKEGTLQMLYDIFNENKDTVIILLSHFPTWLETFGEYLTKRFQNTE